MVTPLSLFSRTVDLVLRRKLLCIFIVVVFLAIVGISTLYRGGLGDPPRRTDLTVYLSAAEAIKTGDNIYFVTNDRGWYYVYMPLLAILLVPFTKLPLLLNTSLWYMLSVLSLFGMVILSARPARNMSDGIRAAVMAILFCMPSILESITRAQTGVMVAFFAVAILYLYMKGWGVWAGILFAFAVVLKSSPLAFLIVFFIVKREWKIVASAALGILFFALAFPSLVIGPERNWLFLNEWHNTLSQAVSSTGKNSRIWGQLATPISADNQSLYATLTRWFYQTETNLAAYGNFWVKWGVRAFSGIALVALAFVSRRKKGPSSPNRIMLEYSLFAILMLLASPVNEMHHYTVFFSIFFPIFLYLDDLPRNSLSYQALMWSSLLAFLAQAVGHLGPFDEWGVPSVATLIIWCVSFAFLARPKNK
ncbi:MAG: glycosyltransferase family 87 protein [Candidatus Omnitrophica bacterium]|nr:glycosyltransferase family 87 protein [Candidatus Omnitrophota bacterium]